MNGMLGKNEREQRSEEEEDGFGQDYQDEEQLYEYLVAFKRNFGDLEELAKSLKEFEAQLRLTYTNKREELDYLYDSQSKELQRAATLD